MFSHRTDLAIEASELYKEQNKNTTEIDGVISCTEERENFSLTKVRITNKNGEKALGKSQGIYITYEVPNLIKSDSDISSQIINSLKEELINLTEKYNSYLICGLGNRHITPDSIGPDVASQIFVTRHLKENFPDDMWREFSSVSAISPGVLGITGIETIEIIKGVCEKIKPDVVIITDALAARKTSRICRSIQITDTGITPGSGIGNHRKAINSETLGIPTIAIGVPMVIDIGTIVLDVLNENNNTNISNCVSNDSNMIVTPKDIDVLTKKIAFIISKAINYAVHRNLNHEDIDAIVSEI